MLKNNFSVESSNIHICICARPVVCNTKEIWCSSDLGIARCKTNVPFEHCEWQLITHVMFSYD